jgi:hypothetical protein
MVKTRDPIFEISWGLGGAGGDKMLRAYRPMLLLTGTAAECG